MPDIDALARIVIFARWPEPGRVKTRLARVYGNEGAAAIYRRLLEHNIKAARTSGLPVELCVTGAPVESFRSHFGDDIAFAEQGEGELGARLARVEPPALVIGSDLPGLTPDLLRMAADALLSHEIVIGPARDGGYWLIGLRAASPWLFDDMAWSTPEVLTETLDRCAARGIAPAMLPELADVDEPDDLAQWPEYLP